ncbi:MAG: hypothetical protein WA151_02200 [Desulfatirhabdiaceae bacterium]
MEKEELIVLLTDDVSIGGYLLYDDILEACDDAAADTGWVFPVDDTFCVRWTKQRARRHCYFKLWSQSASKFKVEQVNLNQRFDHYGKLIDQLDLEFTKVVEDNPEKFAGVETYKMFGTVAGPGFKYDELGRDITYK